MLPAPKRHWLRSLLLFRPGFAALFAVALIPGILVGALLCYGIYKSERDRIEEGARLTARALLKAIDAELVKAEITTRVLAGSEHLAKNNLPAFYQQAIEAIKISGIGSNYVLSDPYGQQLLNTARALDSELPRHGNPEQFERVLASGRPVISDIYIGPVLRRPLISIDVPVMVDGRIAYILSLGLLPEHFSQLLIEQKLPDGWITTLLDTQYSVVARNLHPEQSVGKKPAHDLLAKMRQNPEGSAATDSLEGMPSHVAFVRSATSGWTIAIGLTRDVLYPNLYYLIALVVFSFFALLIGGAVLARIFSRYVRHSLEALGAVTEAAALGDKDARAPSFGIEEIAHLAEQFNRMQVARKQMEEQIERLAFHDSLTMLPNRRLLDDRLHQAMALGERSGRHGALLFLDLDNFKPLNDRHGHAVGDLLLLEVAARLGASVREADTVARFGGDEFVVLLNDLDSDLAEATKEAARVAEKIRLKLGAPYRLSIRRENQAAATVEHHCTVTIGVTLFAGNRTHQDEIVKQADSAMYQAKKAGRDLVRFHQVAG